MFKRVTEKQRKRKELEELGLDDVLSEDSSDSGSESPSDSEDDIGTDGDEQDAGEVKDPEDVVMGAMDEDVNGGDEDDDEDDDPPMSIEEAKQNPIYPVSEETDIYECIVCPTKTLKKESMVSVHVQSSSHKRRFQRFLEAIKDTTYGTDDPRLIVEAISTLTHNPPSLTSITGVLSNRGKKRKEKMDQIRNMRTAQKEMKAKAIRKRDVKRAAATKAAEDGGVPDGKGTVEKVDSKRKGKSGESERPTKKRKISKEASQKVVDKASTNQSSDEKKTKRSSKSDSPSTPTPDVNRASQQNAHQKEKNITKSSESDRPKSKKRRRPHKSKGSE